MKCNLCGSTQFIDMNNRKQVQCKTCLSLERTRIIYLYIQKLNLGRDSKVLHFAPERGLYNALSNLVDEDNYTVADINPKQYKFAKGCQQIDLCELDEYPSNHYDLILHLHVLEHVPCNIAYTLFHLHRMLKDGGRHLFVVPFMGGKYDETFQDIGDEEAVRRFGQFDHVRRFGNKDIDKHLGKLLNMPDHFDAAEDFSPEQLDAINVPENQRQGFHGGTILNLEKYDMKFLSRENHGEPMTLKNKASRLSRFFGR